MLILFLKGKFGKVKFTIKISFEQAKFAIKKEFSPIILEKRVFFFFFKYHFF